MPARKPQGVRLIFACLSLAITLFITASGIRAAQPALLPPSTINAAAASCDDIEGRGEKTLEAKGGRIVCFYQSITRPALKKLMTLSVHDDAIIVVKSWGGDGVAALDIAEFLSKRHVTVVVNGICASACADFIFLFGYKKAVMPNSFVAFHGALTHDRPWVHTDPRVSRGQVDDDVQKQVKAIIQRQDTMFNSIGVDSRLVSTPPAEWLADKRSFEHKFWEYGPNILKTRFGVEGIVYFADPSQRSPWRRLYDFIWYGLSCKEVEVETWLCTT